MKFPSYGLARGLGSVLADGGEQMKTQDKLAAWLKGLKRLGYVRIDGKVYSEREILREAEQALRKGEPIRAWINQPSTQQPLHELHGTNGLWAAGTFFFLEGEVTSMRCPSVCISEGWQ